MTVAARATSAAETPVFFHANGETLFGILTEPPSEPLGVAVVLMNGGGLGPSPGRNQTNVRLCRRLAEQGYHAFRYDYHGVGESTGRVERFRLDEPFTKDAEAAIDWLRNMGISQFVLAGGCFGARTALACVPTTPGLVGLVLKALPVRDKEKDELGVRAFVPNRTLWQYAKRGFSPRVVRGLFTSDVRRAYVWTLSSAWRARSQWSHLGDRSGVPRWISTPVLSGLKSAIERHIPLLVISGTRDPGFEDLDRVLSDHMGDLFKRAGPLAEIRVLEGRVAADASLHQPVIDLILDWLMRSSGFSRSAFSLCKD